MSWSVIMANDSIRQHVVPDKDMRPHRISIDCWCHPTRDIEDENVIIHNSMDEREKYEQGRSLS